MIFRQWQRVLDGTKTQTRRLVHSADVPILDEQGNVKAILRKVGNYRKRTIARVGNTYAIQPGRGKKAVGRFRLVAIRRERLQDISHRDALAEGIDPGAPYNDYGTGSIYVDTFAEYWDSIHTKKGDRWADDPEVWVREMEV